MDKPYNDYGSWMREQFPWRVQKIPVDAGFSCPNRDGTLGRGGCAYCNNESFTPAYCDRRLSIAEQIERGKHFFKHPSEETKYLAYFQSFTNTNESIDTLQRVYEEALAVRDVVGLVIGTRPDCVTPTLLDYLERLSRQTFLCVEYGIETCNDLTLRRINRGHDYATARRAVVQTAARGITVGGHVILGLPGEDAAESILQAEEIARLPLTVLKIHQLQVVRGTALARQYEHRPFPLYTADGYMQVLAEYIRRLPPTLVLERFVSQCPSPWLIAPRWGLKPDQFAARFRQYLLRHNIRQGDSYPSLYMATD